MAQSSAWRLLYAALLCFLAACEKAPVKIPYHGECECMCSASRPPCETISFSFCDIEGQTLSYQKKIGAACLEFGTEKGYFDCALVPLGKPGEPSTLITSKPTVNYCD